MEVISKKEYNEFLKWKWNKYKSKLNNNNQNPTNIGIPIAIFVISIVLFVFDVLSWMLCFAGLSSATICKIDFSCIAGTIPIFVLSLILLSHFKQNKGLNIAIISVDSTGTLILLGTVIATLCFIYNSGADFWLWLMYGIIVAFWAALVPLSSVLFYKAYKAKRISILK